METLLFMLPFMVTVGVAFVAMFLWAIRAGQYDDLEGEKHRIFFEPDASKAQGDPAVEAHACRRPPPGQKGTPP
ncbi:MAG: cbb3-type cytochrome oxidase assembly protein CcoS [Candidatus Sericytochromatia bacterium]|nr:cbb3-type cytochrome oxidase assembly protein CcoS [Candidatus Sericytochromatia bacterium]